MYRFHVRLMCPKDETTGMYSFGVRQWVRQDFKGEGHYIKVKGQKAKMTSQCTGPMLG